MLTSASPVFLAALLALTLIVKLVVGWQLSHEPLLQPYGGLDAEYYVTLARQVASGDWMLGHDPFFLSPLYIYFLGTIFAVSGGSLAAARSVQAALGTVAVWLVYRTGRVALPPRTAFVAAVLAAATGLFTFHEALTIQAALDPFLAALALWLVSEALTSERRRWLFGAGVALGLFALNRPNGLLVAAAIVLVIAVHAPWRRGIGRAAWVLIGLALAIAPVTLRNVVASGDAVLISSHGGLNFYIGNNANADGTYRAVAGVRPSIVGQAEDARLVAEKALGRPVRASEVSSFFFDRAIDWIRSEPARALALFARKLVYTFNSADIALNYSYSYYSHDEPTWLRWLIVGPWCVLPIGLVGAGVIAWDQRRLPSGGRRQLGDAPLSWIVFVVAYALSVALFFVSGRYRLPLLVPLCLTSAAAIERFAQSQWQPTVRRRRAALWVLAIATAAVLTNWPLGLDDGRDNEREELIQFLLDNHRDGEAKDLIARTEPTHRDPARLLLRVGTALIERGDAASAVPYLEQALQIAPGNAHISRALGRAFYDAGETRLQTKEPAAALPLLDRAVALDPQDAAVREKRGVALVMLDRTEDARAELEQARRLDPNSASICLNLAVVYAKEERIDAARTLAQEALRLQPDYPQARGLLAALDRIR
jgi:tetratricopeptide (TPR) repeat protein